LSSSLALPRCRGAAFDPQLETWASGSDLAFLEWRLKGELHSRPFDLRCAERVTLAADRLAAAAVYFDTLSLVDPETAGAGTIFGAPKPQSAS
jgi:hypothetical protein